MDLSANNVAYLDERSIGNDQQSCIIMCLQPALFKQINNPVHFLSRAIARELSGQASQTGQAKLTVLYLRLGYAIGGHIQITNAKVELDRHNFLWLKRHKAERHYLGIKNCWRGTVTMHQQNRAMTTIHHGNIASSAIKPAHRKGHKPVGIYLNKFFIDRVSQLISGHVLAHKTPE